MSKVTERVQSDGPPESYYRWAFKRTPVLLDNTEPQFGLCLKVFKRKDLTEGAAFHILSGSYR